VGFPKVFFFLIGKVHQHQGVSFIYASSETWNKLCRKTFST